MAALQSDVLNPRSDYHQVTAVLDKVAAGELIGRRQDMATNQLLSHALEQLLIRGKRARDTETVTIRGEGHIRRERVACVGQRGARHDGAPSEVRVAELEGETGAPLEHELAAARCGAGLTIQAEAVFTAPWAPHTAGQAAHCL